MKTSPTKRGEKPKFEKPNFKLAKTRVAMRELKQQASSMLEYTTMYSLNATINVEDKIESARIRKD
jgi:hypothetical protein